MATLITKNSSTASSVPTNAQLVQGELAVNVTDKRLYTENASGTVVELGTNPGSAVTHTAGTAGAPAITTTGDTNTGLFFPAADTVAASTGGAERLRLDSSGNLGLGATPSAWSLGKAIEVGTVGNSIWGVGSSNMVVGSNIYYASSSYKYANTAAASAYQQAGGVHYWYTAASGTAGNTISFTQAMTLDASGNLGVGTTSPSYKLQVNNASSSATADAVTVQNSGVSAVGDAAGIRFRFVTAEPAAIRAILTNNVNGSGALGLFTSSDGTGANITERARITSGGDLLVNRTSTLGTAKFVVEADTTTANPMTVSNSRSTTATDYSILFYRNASLVGSVQTSLTATSYVTSSDYRLKENIQPMTGALAKVAALKPVTYKWKATGGEADGFIAHELAEVCPQAVTGEKDAVDADGNPVYQGIDTSFLVATLTAALQELKAELDSVKTELNALKGT